MNQHASVKLQHIEQLDQMPINIRFVGSLNALFLVRSLNETKGIKDRALWIRIQNTHHT